MTRRGLLRNRTFGCPERLRNEGERSCGRTAAGRACGGSAMEGWAVPCGEWGAALESSPLQDILGADVEVLQRLMMFALRANS